MPRISGSLLLILPMVCIVAPSTRAQQAAAPNEPQVKVNVLNVCTPSAEEQKEISSALARIPKQPLFGTDFEVSRGKSTMADLPSFLPAGQTAHMAGEPPVASYVRMRREFSVQALFSSVQYSFSNDGQNMVETLVLHVRDPKDLIMVSLEDSATSVTSPSVMLSANTPVSRVRLERFGKSSVALSRCPVAQDGTPINQSAYEPLFRGASEVLVNYRRLLGVQNIVPEELAKIEPGTKTAAPKNAARSKLRRPVEEKR